MAHPQHSLKTFSEKSSFKCKQFLIFKYFCSSASTIKIERKKKYFIHEWRSNKLFAFALKYSLHPRTRLSLPANKCFSPEFLQNGWWRFSIFILQIFALRYQNYISTFSRFLIWMMGRGAESRKITENHWNKTIVFIIWIGMSTETWNDFWIFSSYCCSFSAEI